MNIQANQLDKVVDNSICLLDMDYDIFIALLELSMELVLC